MNRIPYVKVIKVGRLNYVYMCKYKALTPIKVNSVRSTSYKNPVQSFHETDAGDKVYPGQWCLHLNVSCKFCHNDIFTQHT